MQKEWKKKTEVQEKYEKFLDAYKKAYPGLVLELCLIEAKKEWLQVKFDPETFNDKINEYHLKVSNGLGG